MADELLTQGGVEFKRGIMGKWKNVYCTVRPRMFTVYDGKTCENRLHVFTPEQSWISAAHKTDSGLFVLNMRPRSATSVKNIELYLFDTKAQSNLVQWIKGLQRAGWKSAILSDRLRYHQRSLHLPESSSKEDGSRGTLSLVDETENKGRNENVKMTTNMLERDSNNNTTIDSENRTVELCSARIYSNSSDELNINVHLRKPKIHENEKYYSTGDIQSQLIVDDDLIAYHATTLNSSMTSFCGKIEKTTSFPFDDVTNYTLPSNEAEIPSSNDFKTNFIDSSSDAGNLNNNKGESLPYGETFDFNMYLEESQIDSLELCGNDSNGCDDNYVEKVHDNAESLKEVSNTSDSLSPEDSSITSTANYEQSQGLNTVAENLGDSLLPYDQRKDCLSVESGYCSKESLSTCDDCKCSQQQGLKEIGNAEAIAEQTDVAVIKQRLEEKIETEKECQLPENPVPSMSSTAEEENKTEDITTKPEVLKKFQEVNSTHEKLSKRQSMTNILAQFKNKISMNKKKVHKKADRMSSKILFSTKLLWNDGDEWKDRWFKLQEHNLLCFKDSSMKAQEFSVDVRKCVIALPQGAALQGMNIFTLTCENQEVYQLAAWSDHHLQNWIRALDQYSNSGSLSYCDEVDGSSCDIVPYGEALEVRTKVQETTVADKTIEKPINHRTEATENEPLHSQGSMDSGNDGDESESGLESSGASLSDIKEFATRRKHQINRRKMGIHHTEVLGSTLTTDVEQIDSGECTSDRAESLHTVPSFDEEEEDSEDIFVDSLSSESTQDRRTSIVQRETSCDLQGTDKSISSTTTYKSVTSMYTTKKDELSNLNSQSGRCRQVSIESSASADVETSSVGSPTEKVVLIDEYSNYRSHPAAVSPRKYSVESCTSFESECESVSGKKQPKFRIKLRDNVKSDSNGNGRGVTSTGDDVARRLLLAEVLRQRENASRNLTSRLRTDSDESRSTPPRCHTVSETNAKRPSAAKTGLLKRVSSQGVLQSWDVKVENVVKVTEESDTIELRPLSPNTLKNNYVRNVVDLKPISVDISTNDNQQMSGSLGSEDSDEFFSFFGTESQAELEKTVRNETLLRKRRNSLSLTRESIQKNLESIRRKASEDKENSNFRDCIHSLEVQLNDISKEINSIERNLCVQTENMIEIVKRKRKMTKRANAVFSRLRHPLTSRMHASTSKLDSEGNPLPKESGFKFRKRSTSSMTTASHDGFFDNRYKNGIIRNKKLSTSSDPRPDSSVSSVGSSVDLRNLEDDTVDGSPKNNGLKTRSKSVGNILQLNYTGTNGLSVLENPRSRQRKISREAMSKIEDFMEFSREMVSELTSRKNSDSLREVIEV